MGFCHDFQGDNTENKKEIMKGLSLEFAPIVIDFLEKLNICLEQNRYI